MLPLPPPAWGLQHKACQTGTSRHGRHGEPQTFRKVRSQGVARPDHHLYGPEAVHKNAEVAKILHREGQKAFERTYPDLDFREIFGKNYLGQSMGGHL